MCKHFSYATDYINLLNKALLKWLVQGLSSVLPHPNVQPEVMKDKPVSDPWLERVCAGAQGRRRRGHFPVEESPPPSTVWMVVTVTELYFQQSKMLFPFEAIYWQALPFRILNVVKSLNLNIGKAEIVSYSSITGYLIHGAWPEPNSKFFEGRKKTGILLEPNKLTVCSETIHQANREQY